MGDWYVETKTEQWAKLKQGNRTFLLNPDAVAYFEERPQRDIHGRSMPNQKVVEVFFLGAESIELNGTLEQVTKAFGFGKE